MKNLELIYFHTIAKNVIKHDDFQKRRKHEGFSLEGDTIDTENNE